MSTKNTSSYPAPGERLEDHPYAELFPMMDSVDNGNLEEMIKQSGQREPIVILENKILDGRNRYAICLRLGIEPKFRPYDYVKDGKSPLHFVMDHNLGRRHLSTSQRATVASLAMPLFDEEAKLAKIEGGKAAHAAPAEGAPSTAGEEADPYSQLPGHSDENISQVPAPSSRDKSGKRKPRTSAKAAAMFNVSPRSVETAAALQKTDPKGFEDVKAGKITLNAATKAAEEKAKNEAAFPDAVQRIKNVCGPSLAAAVQEGTRLKNAKEAIAYAALSNDEMLRIRALIEEGWPVAKAVKYKADALCRTHRIGDLINRATNNGGMFTLEIEGYRVFVSKIGVETPAPDTAEPSPSNQTVTGTTETLQTVENPGAVTIPPAGEEKPATAPAGKKPRTSKADRIKAMNDARAAAPTTPAPKPAAKPRGKKGAVVITGQTGVETVESNLVEA